MLRRVACYKFTDVSEVHNAAIVIALMMKTSTSETSVNLHQATLRNI
jgi:hypothetical protein